MGAQALPTLAPTSGPVAVCRGTTTGARCHMYVMTNIYIIIQYKKATPPLRSSPRPRDYRRAVALRAAACHTHRRQESYQRAGIGSRLRDATARCAMAPRAGIRLVMACGAPRRASPSRTGERPEGGRRDATRAALASAAAAAAARGHAAAAEGAAAVHRRQG